MKLGGFNLGFIPVVFFDIIARLLPGVTLVFIFQINEPVYSSEEFTFPEFSFSNVG